MTLPLTPEVCRGAYDYLRVTKPFDGWNLPEGEDLTFKVSRSRKLFGCYYVINARHVIMISARKHGHSLTLLMTMAHEMIHLYQFETGMFSPKTVHNEAFNKLAGLVCRLHGFDPKLF